MASTSIPRIGRIALGLTLLGAGAAVFAVRPGIAQAHHAQASMAGDCAAWTTKGEYIGGSEDRKAVVDVAINGEHVLQTFYFDDGPGHLGHQDYWLLYERSGSGSLTVSGTIVLYRRDGSGAYTIVDNSELATANLVCATATTSATATYTSTRTATPNPTDTASSTPTPVDTPTPEASETPEPFSTSTAIPTNTAAATSTSTPAHTATSTAVTEGTVTPLAPASTPTGGSPTLVSTVEALLPPGRPEGPSTTGAPPSETASGLPNAGTFATGGRDGLLRGLFGLLLSSAGLAALSSGLRRQRG